MSYYRMAARPTTEVRSGRPEEIVSDMVIMTALRDVQKQRAPHYATAVAFFESGLFHLFADVLGIEHQAVYEEYLAVKRGEKAVTSGKLNNPLTEEEVLEARELSESGVNNAQIGQRMGRSAAAISRVTRDITAKRVRVVTPEEHKRMRNLYLAGKTLTEISRATGWSHFAVSKHTADLRVPRRKEGEKE